MAFGQLLCGLLYILCAFYFPPFMIPEVAPTEIGDMTAQQVNKSDCI
jgi:hypothetical protein